MTNADGVLTALASRPKGKSNPKRAARVKRREIEREGNEMTNQKSRLVPSCPLGRLIVDRMAELGIESLAEVSRRMGYKSPKSIGDWYNGRMNPDMLNRAKLAEVLGITTNEVGAAILAGKSESK